MHLFWRRVWDSNPRAREGYLISSQARYDHFDNSPRIYLQHQPSKALWKKKRIDGENKKLFNC